MIIYEISIMYQALWWELRKESEQETVFVLKQIEFEVGWIRETKRQL